MLSDYSSETTIVHLAAARNGGVHCTRCNAWQIGLLSRHCFNGRMCFFFLVFSGFCVLINFAFLCVSTDRLYQFNVVVDVGCRLLCQTSARARTAIERIIDNRDNIDVGKWSYIDGFTNRAIFIFIVIVFFDNYFDRFSSVFLTSLKVSIFLFYF